jgi:hypothetical protein
MPETHKKCMASWKAVMPDYGLVLWDTSKFDINSVPFVAEACRKKKWAFAADYIRLYALYTEGGVYLDTDVVVRKRFDDFLMFDFFSSVEWHKGKEKSKPMAYLTEGGQIVLRVDGVHLQAAIMGGTAGHPFLQDCLDWYNTNHFLDAKGNTTGYNKDFIAPHVYAAIAQKYGFRYKNELQNLLGNMVVFPSDVFAGWLNDITNNTYAVHCCAGSWRDKSFVQAISHKLYRKLADNTTLRKIAGKKPVEQMPDIVERVISHPYWREHTT